MSHILTSVQVNEMPLQNMFIEIKYQSTIRYAYVLLSL